MQNNRRSIDINILKRYLEGNGSPEDANIIRLWLENPESDQELIEKSRQFWDETAFDPDIKGYDSTHILDQIHHKIRSEEEVTDKKPDKKVRIIKYLTRIAAILFIPLVTVTMLLYFQYNNSSEIKSFSEIYSPNGTRTNFYLPDGSTGWLNGGSSLKFPTQFNGNLRDVKLVGEAYFNVTSNHKKPFIVSTKYIDIKVYGTSFNVMAYADEQTTEVTLERGVIELFRKSDNSVKNIGILKPNEFCTYNNVSDSSKIVSINSAEKLSWLDGKLTFRYEPFEEVIHKINRWYNVNMVIKDEQLNNQKYYGTFKDETLEEVLKLLKYTAPITYKDFARERKQDGTFEKRRIEIYYKK